MTATAVTWLMQPVWQLLVSWNFRWEEGGRAKAEGAFALILLSCPYEVLLTFLWIIVNHWLQLLTA